MELDVKRLDRQHNEVLYFNISRPTRLLHASSAPSKIVVLNKTS